MTCFPLGGRWWRQPPKGAAAVRRHLYWRRKAPYLANAVVLHNSLGRQALKPSGRRSRFRTEPLAPRGESTGGAINPRGEAASTFGNTAKRRFPSKASRLKYRTQQKSTNDFSLVLFQVNQQLVPPGDSSQNSTGDINAKHAKSTSLSTSAFSS